MDYKRLPYKTVFVEFSEIARVSQEIGAKPTGTWPDGSPKYTVPAIYDPSTKTAVSDSVAIAQYLDATYPDTPRVIPEGTEAFQETVLVALRTVVGPHSGPLVMTLVPPLLSTTRFNALHLLNCREDHRHDPLLILSKLPDLPRELHALLDSLGLLDERSRFTRPLRPVSARQC